MSCRSTSSPYLLTTLVHRPHRLSCLSSSEHRNERDAPRAADALGLLRGKRRAAIGAIVFAIAGFQALATAASHCDC